MRPHPNQLPRLPREYYQGDAIIHWTQATWNRASGWISDLRHAQFRELLLHVAVREGLHAPVYCIMPDHIHLVWMGLRRTTDQLKAMRFLRTHFEPLLAPARFQTQAHDHVLRESQRERGAFASVCAYILENPMRGRVADTSMAWPYCGSVVPGYPRLDPRETGFWDRFWKIHWVAREPDAGEIARPPWTPKRIE